MEISRRGKQEFGGFTRSGEKKEKQEANAELTQLTALQAGNLDTHSYTHTPFLHALTVN